MKRITIKDIAAHLAISVSTVSRALADDKNIKLATRELVHATAEKLGYRRNPLAANLRKRRADAIGIIVQEMTTPFASTVIKGIQRVLYAKGLKVLIADSNESSHRESDNLDIMERFMVDGIIMCMCDWRKNIEQINRIRHNCCPMVFFDRLPHGIDNVSQVIIDDYHKAFFLVEHLIQTGRRNIVCIKGPESCHNFDVRTQAYRDALHKFKLNDSKSLIFNASEITADEGRRIADALIDSKIEFDAVFATTDLLAIGAMNRLREHGLEVPSDVAVAGFSGTSLSEIVYPPLTTVEPPLEEMGERAAELLLRHIADSETKPQSIYVDSTIQIRASTVEAGRPD